MRFKIDEDLPKGLAGLLASEEDVCQISQRAAVRPNKFYRLRGKLKLVGGKGRVTVGVLRPEHQQEITDVGKWVDVDIDMLGREHLEEMGWTQDAAIPTRATLERLGLADIAGDLWKE